MTPAFRSKLLDKLQATDLVEPETLQELWSGYGTIQRFGVEGGLVDSVVIKQVRPPSNSRHPRGWDGERSHQRKLHSYQVETAWYRDWSQQGNAACRMPQCFASNAHGDEVSIALEDLRGSGYVSTPQSVSLAELKVCIRWLAHFHAAFMGATPTDLWKIGTYWHLDTRPDELARLQDEPLRHAARGIDRLLNQARFQTIVHGDAKLANFCFSADRQRVAAVDFQYVGGGCGMKDLAYLLGGCLSSAECVELEGPLLDHYFETLKSALRQLHSNLDLDALEDEWRALYAPAWADFHRFLKGWSPDHWKLNAYGEHLTQTVIASLRDRD